MLLAVLLCACGGQLHNRPQRRDIVASVRVDGIADEKIEKKILEGIGTRPSTSFLWRHTYESYDSIVLQRDLLRIERELRRHGYYEAKVRAARVIVLKEIEKQRVVLSPVDIEIEVEPGPPVTIGKLETKGLAALSFEVGRAAARENRLREGQIFDEREFENAKVDIANSLADRGYAFAQVAGKASVDLAQKKAHVIMEARPGPRSVLGPVSIEGLEKLSEKPVRRILHLSEGDLYSRKRIRAARSALFGLGTFSKIEIIPDLSHPEQKVVPLTVRLSESSLHELKLGGGGRLDLLRLAIVGQATWTHLNFLGGLRKLTIGTRPGLTLFPTRFPAHFDGLVAPTNVFPENFLNVRLEQPGFIEARTTGFHEGAYNIYPLLYTSLASEGDPREERVVGYHEFATSVGLDRGFFDQALQTTLSLHWQANFPFNYQTPQSGLEDDRSLLDVQVIYPALSTRLQFLDDPIEPKRGFVFSNEVQLATGLFGTLQDVRISPELKAFVPLDNKQKVVFAARFGVGMLLGANYGEALRSPGHELDTSDPSVFGDQQKMVFRAFYSGGPGSNRGYPYRRVGPQGPIAFLLPRGADCDVDPNKATCLRPLGGFSLWEASAEIRYRAFPKWSFVAFVDASDVSTEVATFDFLQPHLSVGPGIRYHSPVGPVRFDWGIRLPGLQSLRTPENEPRDVSETPPYDRDGSEPYDDAPWYDRFAFHILIGEDF